MNEVVDKIWVLPNGYKIWCDTKGRYNGNISSERTIQSILEKPGTYLSTLTVSYYGNMLEKAELIYNRHTGLFLNGRCLLFKE